MFLQLIELLDECTHALQEFLGHDEDLLLVFVLHVLSPSGMNHRQDGHEVLLPCDENLLVECFVPQTWLGGQCQLQRSLIRDVHDDEVHRLTRGLHIAVILLRRQALELLSNTSNHFLCQLFALCLVFCLDIFGIGVDGHLSIYHHVFVIRIVKDGIGHHLSATLIVEYGISLLVGNGML